MSVAFAWTLRIVGALAACGAVLRLAEEAFGWWVRRRCRPLQVIP